MAEYPETIKEDLSHVRWICGSVLGGKTTITKKLASKLEVQVHHIDSHYPQYFQRADEIKHPWLSSARAFYDEGKTPAELALLPIEQQKEGWIGVYEETFPMIIEDLLACHNNKILITDGVTLPERICEVSPVENTLCLLAAKEFMRSIKEHRANNPDETIFRPDESRKWREAHQKELRQIEKRGFWVAEWLRDQMLEKAQAVGMKVIINDGSKSIDELTEMVREHFGL